MRSYVSFLRKFNFKFNQKFLIYTITIILLTSSLATLTYYAMSTYNSFRRQVNLYKKNCQNISSFLTMSIEEVNAIYNLLSVDRDIYEWLQNSYFNTNIDYYNLSKVQKRFLDIINSNDKITSFYIHNKGNNIVLSTDYALHDLESFPKNEVFKNFYSQEQLKRWFELPADNSLRNSSSKTLCYVASLPANLKLGTVSINVNEKKLMQELYNNNLYKDNEGVILLDSFDDVIACSRDNYGTIFSALRKQIMPINPNEIDYKSISFHGEKYYSFIWSSSDNNYKVIYMVLGTEILSGIDSGDTYILFSILLFSIIALILLYVFKKMYSNPLNLYDENLQANLEDLKDKFITNILTGSLQEKDISAKAKDFGINLNSKYFMVAVFQINDYYNYLIELDEDKRFLINNRIFNSIKCMFMVEHTSYIVNTELGNFAILLSVNSDIHPDNLAKNLENIIRYMQNELKENCGLSACAALSDICQDVKNINMCYLQALRLLQHKLIHGKYSIIQSKDFSHTNVSIEQYPTNGLNKIIEFIKLGNIEMVEKSIDSVCNEVLSNNLYPVDIINTILSNILYSIIKLTLEFRYQIGDVFKNDVFLKLYSYEFLQDKKTYILDLCSELIQYRRSKESTSKKKTIQVVLNYIYENYDKPTSLNIIADHLEMNASYLSSLIKEELGIGFVDLLNDLRLKKSVGLLKEGKLSIKQIAEQCGYENPHSFIRNFKKVYIVTPAEFKSKLT